MTRRELLKLIVNSLPLVLSAGFRNASGSGIAAAASSTPLPAFALLEEDGALLLTENGDYLALET